MLSSALVLPAYESWLWFISIITIVRLLYCRYHHSLYKYNGPFLASITDSWRMYHAYRNRYSEPMVDMHEKYGSVVRMGPNVLSFGQPQAIRDIYGPGKNFIKSEFYSAQSPVNKGELAQTLFTSSDQVWHRNLRKSIGSAFTMSTVIGYEETVDTVIDILLQELEERFSGKPNAEGAVDLFTWTSYFTFDVMGSLSYGGRHGFLESGEDVHGIMSFVSRGISYGFFTSQNPIVATFLNHNPILLWLERRGWFHSSPFPGAPLALKHMRERQKRYENNNPTTEGSREDLLDKFMKAGKQHPDIVREKEILGLSISMIIAGAESTAISLTAFFYYLLRTPGCYPKLQEELDTQLSSELSEMSYHKTLFSEAWKLPYLNACIQEAFRLHPPVSFTAERIVPPAGDTIDGHFVPGGTVVGCNPWVVHRDKATFGEDVDQYRPERWLGEPETVYRMSQALFQFGSGNHICLGKNIAYLEIYKLIPSLMRTFEISLDDPEKEWTRCSGGVVRTTDFNVRINRRESASR